MTKRSPEHLSHIQTCQGIQHTNKYLIKFYSEVKKNMAMTLENLQKNLSF